MESAGISALCLYVGLLLSATSQAEPLDLTIPKHDLATKDRVFSIEPRTASPAMLLMLDQIVSRIERAATWVEWPRNASGEKVYGSVRATISIHINGKVVDIQAANSGVANDAELIQSATRVIRASEPFTENLSKAFPDVEVIRFVRTFNFNRSDKPRIQ